MRIKIECEIEVDENIWVSHDDKEEHEWFKSILEDKEDTMLILWSNDVGDEIGQTSNFKYEIL